MALAIDGSAVGNWSAGATIVSGTLTTTNATDVLVCVVHTENPSAAAPTVSSISQPSGVGTWTKRKAFTFSGPDLFHDLEVWWAATTSTISSTITVTLSGTPDDGAINVFGVSGANTTTPWDSNASLPATATGTTGAASVSGVSTTNANDMLLGFMGWGNTITDPGNNTAGLMAGTTGTLIRSTDSSFIVCASEQRVVSATVSSASIAFGSSSTVEWLMIADAIVAASGAATVFPPWTKPGDPDRTPVLLFQRDSVGRQWFQPSPNPVPTVFWTPPISDREKLPPIQRSPDEPRLNTYFIRSPNPVPTTWLPTTGMEDRPPEPKKRPDDGSIESPQYFRAPSSFPAIRLPTTGQEDRPPNPNRIPSPDQFFPWFVRSPNPVPIIWLPRLDGGERLKPPVLDPSGSTFTPKPTAVPISGIAWYKWEDRERPAPVWPKPGNKFFSVQISTAAVTTWLPQWDGWERAPPVKRQPDEAKQWFVQSPNPVPNTWVPITGEREQRPPPVWPKPGNKFFSSQVSAAVPVSGTAWNNYWDQPPYIVKPSTEKIVWAPVVPTVVSTIAGIAWATRNDDRPLPLGEPQPALQMPFFIEPPLIPFYAAANADDFKPLKAIQPADIVTSWAPRSFAAPVGISGIAWWRQTEVYVWPGRDPVDYHLAWDPRFIAPPVGIAGIAWWRQTEVYLEPPASYRDYKPAWDPQFIIQIIPTPPLVATYYLLEDYFVSNPGILLQAGTVQQTAPAGFLPAGWTPGPNVDPIDANAVTAYTLAGYQPRNLIRTQFTNLPVAPPNYVWQLLTGEWTLVKVR